MSRVCFGFPQAAGGEDGTTGVAIGEGEAPAADAAGTPRTPHETPILTPDSSAPA